LGKRVHGKKRRIRDEVGHNLCQLNVEGPFAIPMREREARGTPDKRVSKGKGTKGEEEGKK